MHLSKKLDVLTHKKKKTKEIACDKIFKHPIIRSDPRSVHLMYHVSCIGWQIPIFPSRRYWWLCRLRPANILTEIVYVHERPQWFLSSVGQLGNTDHHGILFSFFSFLEQATNNFINSKIKRYKEDKESYQNKTKSQKRKRTETTPLKRLKERIRQKSRRGDIYRIIQKAQITLHTAIITKSRTL